MSKTQTSAPVPENPAQPLPMKVDVKISSIRPEGNIRAYASINLNDCFAIRNVKVVDSSKGLFIAMPSRKKKDGTYADVAHPLNSETRGAIEDAVISEYRRQLNGNAGQLREIPDGASGADSYLGY